MCNNVSVGNASAKDCKYWKLTGGYQQPYSPWTGKVGVDNDDSGVFGWADGEMHWDSAPGTYFCFECMTFNRV